jgi:class 3 adenylate cyclase/tetratricopeptide (TPR) repeat protein/tRNA A37 threonylcarbamoyladenosine biosynthesis protein TsaE
MICPSCGFENPEGFKFCGGCGATLKQVCHNCKNEIPPGFKFCGVCGTPLIKDEAKDKAESSASLDTPKPQVQIDTEDKETFAKPVSRKDAERRNVTVLFSDISGFTAMSEQLDPEEVREIMNECFNKLSQIIDNYEGTIDKFIGDAIMVLFGAPIAHENDPERAIRAAIDMQQALFEFSKNMKSKSGIELKMRVGINTGQVVAGAVGSDLRSDYTVMGDTVNLASRLEHAAPIGGILISDSTYNLAKGIIDVNSLEPIKVKGKSELITVYEVVGVKNISNVSDKKQVPLIGRSEELNQIKKIIDDFSENKQPIVMSLIGEVGFGKNRLIKEFVDKIDPDEISILNGQPLTYARSSSYWMFIDMLKKFFSIKSSDDEETTVKKITKKMSSVLKVDFDEILPYLGSLLSLEVLKRKYAAKLNFLLAEQLKERTFIAIRDLLLAQIKHKPSVIIFQDLQAADDVSLELCEFIIQSLENSPIVFLFSARSSKREALVRLTENALSINKSIKSYTFKLNKLSNEDSKALLHQTVSNLDLPSEIEEIILARADGIPYYIEQIVRMLIDKQIIKLTGNKYELGQVEIETIVVPENLQNLMMARFDGLSEGSKMVGQIASVFGKTFRLSLIDKIVAGETSDIQLDPAIYALEKNEIIVMDTQNGDREYSFKNTLMQETIYNTLLIKKRVSLHEKTGVFIEENYSKRLEEYVELLAHHFRHSENHLKALKYLIASAEKAKKQYANKQAIKYFNHALDECMNLGGTDISDQQIQIYISMADIDFLTGESGQALDKYSFAADLIKKKGTDRVKLAEVYQLKGKTYSFVGDYDSAVEFLNQAEDEIKDIEKVGTELLVARIYDTYGWVNYNKGSFIEASEYGQKALSLLDGGGSLGDIARANNLLGIIDYDMGKWDPAINYFEKSLAICEEIENLRGVSACLNNLALIQSNRGNFEKSLNYHQKSYDIAKKIGDRLGIAVSLSNIGSIYSSRGDFEEAKEKLESALVIANEILADDLIPEINCYLAQTYIGLKKSDGVQKLIDEAVDISKKTGSSYYHALALRVRGEFWLSQNKIDQTIDSLEESLSMFEELEAEYEIGTTAKLLGNLLLKIKDIDDKFGKRAEGLLKRYRNIYEKLGIKARDVQSVNS